ncbi:putative methyltransferase [Crossiella equi]|uniref:Methyltransferase n=3 Tax=Crossiella equi TaxID=130796 RepID=A0ABS5ACM5_9PSEU|nr:bis-aminopropyl spermidine synthase family protein [Crossiella equi]MBP2474338.1 putative methyltransferase [Crossiella equi]
MSTQGNEVLAEIAEAVRLQEGPAGVRAVVRAFRQIGPASTRDVSRHTGLPVPIVAAVGNELRRHGLLGEQRPSRLTDAGLDLIADLGMGLDLDTDCSRCGGLEIPIPRVLQEAVEQLRRISAAGPGADLALDQSHCTAETKVRRVLALIRAGVLPGSSVLLVGDDDQVSIAIAVVEQALGVRLVSRLAVADISDEVLDFIADTASTMDFRVDLAKHDLREPLPERLLGQFDAAMTDPPYTPEGARLFLSRAVEGLRPGPAQSIFFSFGAKGPDEMLAVQQEILGLNLVTHSLIRNFNEYQGSGILGGTGFFQHLLTTEATASSVPGLFEGPLYTREKRSRLREYECGSCGALFPVGAGAEWNSVADLRANGCPKCGKGPFRPRQLIAEGS